MRGRTRGLVLALLVAGCADPGTPGGAGGVSFTISAVNAAAVGSLRLTVLDGNATCSAAGDASGTPLSGLVDLDLQIGVARTLQVPAGMRTFSVVAFDFGSRPLARGCAQRVLAAGATASVAITLQDFPPAGDGELDGALPDGDLPDADVPDGEALDVATFDGPPGSPVNDACNMAVLLGAGTPAIGTLDNSADHLTTSCGGGGRDVFYRIILPVAGGPRSLTAQVTSSFNTTLTLLRGDCTSELTCVGAATPMGDAIDVGNLAPGDYYLAVETVGAASGNFVITYNTGAPRPVNDQCSAGAPLLAAGGTTSGTLQSARDDATGSCGGTGNGDVAYRFVVPAGSNQRATVAVTSAVGFDPVVYARRASCAGTQADCAQFEGGAGETLDMTDLAPGTYFVWVDAAGAVTGAASFDIGLTLAPAVPPPGNDACAAATLLAPATDAAGSTVGAGDDQQPMCATPFDSRDTVHRIDTTAAGAQAVLISVLPSAPAWPVVATLDDALCPATAELACSNGGFDTRYINKPNLPGGSYHVYVDGANGATGAYTIRYDTRPADTTFGYWRIDSTGTYTPLAAGTPVPGFVTGIMASDEAAWAVTLPFTFDFYGTPRNIVNISANLYLTFGAVPGDSNSYNNDCPHDATAPNDAIALFWDDAYAPANAPVAELLTAVEGTAPNRRFIVEYKNWDFIYLQGPGRVNPQNARVSQQAILYENGDIELRYGPRTAGVNQDCGTTRHLGCGATIGLENATASDIDMAQCNMATVTDGKVIYYVHPR